MSMRQQTIYALASGAGITGVAVVRVSGPGCRAVLETMVGSVPPGRRAVVRSIRSRTGDEIDQGLVLWFPGPGSFTGEDVVEFQVHGSRAVVRALFQELSALGARLAEPGEFTRRAHLHGRLDLTAVEGLGDLLAAETEAQRRLAVRVASGELGHRLNDARHAAIRCLAWIEADLDFTDEADVPGSVVDQAFEEIAALERSLASLLTAAEATRRVREGLEVVIAGPPNAGKSSLLKVLAQRDVAIVSDEAGTTRDLIEVRLELAGLAVTLVDTAGLREAQGRIEQVGIERARRRAGEADLVLWLHRADESCEMDEAVRTAAHVWSIRTQIDRVMGAEAAGAGVEFVSAGVDSDSKENDDRHAISVVTGAGIDRFVADLTAFADSWVVRAGDGLVAHERQRMGIEAARQALDAALRARPLGLEFVAEHVREAAHALGTVTGAIGVEDVLGAIFSTFCIGK